MSGEDVSDLEVEYERESSASEATRRRLARSLAESLDDAYAREGFEEASDYRDRLRGIYRDHPDDDEVVRIVADGALATVEDCCRIEAEPGPDPYGTRLGLQYELERLGELAAGGNGHAERCLDDATDLVTETFATRDPEAVVEREAAPLDTPTGLVNRLEDVDERTRIDLSDDLEALRSHLEELEATAEAADEPDRIERILVGTAVAGLFVGPVVTNFAVVYFLRGHGPITAITNQIFLTDLSPDYRIAQIAGFVVLVGFVGYLKLLFELDDRGWF